VTNSLTPPQRVSLAPDKPDFDAFLMQNWTLGISGVCSKANPYMPNTTDCVALHRHKPCASCREFLRIAKLYNEELQRP
jgi:hypothetical protein